jgi:hypothetical protein
MGSQRTQGGVMTTAERLGLWDAFWHHECDLAEADHDEARLRWARDAWRVVLLELRNLQTPVTP